MGACDFGTRHRGAHRVAGSDLAVTVRHLPAIVIIVIVANDTVRSRGHPATNSSWCWKAGPDAHQEQRVGAVGRQPMNRAAEVSIPLMIQVELRRIENLLMVGSRIAHHRPCNRGDGSGWLEREFTRLRAPWETRGLCLPRSLVHLRYAPWWADAQTARQGRRRSVNRLLTSSRLESSLR
jgi:hypothetical protein